MMVVWLCSNFFLDFDGWSHISALEQNFNPSASDVKRKQKRGNLSLLNHVLLLPPPPLLLSLFLHSSPFSATSPLPSFPVTPPFPSSPLSLLFPFSFHGHELLLLLLLLLLLNFLYGFFFLRRVCSSSQRSS
jgi:hypothetical protein